MMEHFYQDIQGYSDGPFLDVYREAVERAPADRLSTFVEVGCWKGRSAAFMAVEIANSGKPIDLYCVDVWAGKATWKEPHGLGACREHSLVNDPDIERIYEIFVENLKPFPFVHPMRMCSLEGATHFVPFTVDFVMLDGSHDYEDVKVDIGAWSPTLKAAGVLAGDDYSWPGVWRAVHECIGFRNVVRRGDVWVSK